MKYCVLAILLITLGCHISKQPAFSESFLAFDNKTWRVSDHNFSNSVSSFSPANVSVSGNSLFLKVTAGAHKDKAYSSGGISSLKEYRFGRFACKMKAAPGSGIISAFFLYSAHNNEPEIDIEICGDRPSDITLSYYKNGKAINQTIPLGFDASHDFHEYAITWLPGKVIWEVDGKPVHEATAHVPKKGMHVLASAWASAPNGWAGLLRPQTLPVQAELKYVKIFKRAL